MNRRYSDPLCRKTVNLDYSKPRINWCVYVCTQMLPYGLPHSVFADCELPQGGEHGVTESDMMSDEHFHFTMLAAINDYCLDPLF